MKKSILAIATFAAGMAFADSTTVTNDLVIGVLPLQMAANQSEIVIAVPWVEAGTNIAANAGVAVSNLVKTAGLTAKDQLLYYDVGQKEFKVWELTDVGGTLYWVPEAEGLAADSATLKRGNAAIVKRLSNVNIATNIFVVGQYTTNAVDNTEIAAAPQPKSSSAFTLAAPPYPEGGSDGFIDLNGFRWNDASPKDTLILGVSSNEQTGVVFYRQLVWGRENEGANYCWGTNYTPMITNGDVTYPGTKVFTPAGKIPVGTGFWYNRTTNEAATVEWTKE